MVAEQTWPTKPRDENSCAVVSYCQSCDAFCWNVVSRGILLSKPKWPPASINKIDAFAPALSRFASTEPVEPAPTIT